MGIFEKNVQKMRMAQIAYESNPSDELLVLKEEAERIVDDYIDFLTVTTVNKIKSYNKVKKLVEDNAKKKAKEEMELIDMSDKIDELILREREKKSRKSKYNV